MKISDYVLEVLENENRANLLEKGKNYYGADVCRDSLDLVWEEWVYALPTPVWQAARRVQSQAIRMMWRQGYDAAVEVVNRLANGEQDF